MRTGKPLAVGPEDKPHASTQLAMVPAGLLESSSASPPQGRTADPRTTPAKAALSPSSLPMAPRQTLRSTTPVEPLRSGITAEPAPGRPAPPSERSASSAGPGPESRSSPQSHTKFLLQLLHSSPALSRPHRPAPLSQSPPTQPSNFGEAEHRGVVPLAWLLYPLCPFPAGATRFPTAHVAPTPPQGRGGFRGLPVTWPLAQRKRCV